MYGSEPAERRAVLPAQDLEQLALGQLHRLGRIDDLETCLCRAEVRALDARQVIGQSALSDLSLVLRMGGDSGLTLAETRASQFRRTSASAAGLVPEVKIDEHIGNDEVGRHGGQHRSQARCA